MVALKQNQGGWLHGLQGVGKTETIKELARALAKQCLIFNCFNGLDTSSIGRIIKVIQFQCNFSAISKHNQCDYKILLQSNFRTNSEQIQSSSKAVPEQFQSSFSAIPEHNQCNYKILLASNFRAVPEQL